MILLILLFIFFIITAVLYMMDTIQAEGEEKIVTLDNLPKEIKVILVLGAGVNEDGKPCGMLIDRLITAVEVSEKIEGSKILLSGDHRSENYNEVDSMKRYFMKNSEDVDESNIFLDHAGFSTYESIYRAKEVFKVNSMIIVTNEYHLPRALYIAEKMNVIAYGVASDSRDYEEIDIYKERELLAQVKDYIYVNILKPKPRYLERSKHIKTSDKKK